MAEPITAQEARKFLISLFDDYLVEPSSFLRAGREPYINQAKRQQRQAKAKRILEQIYGGVPSLTSLKEAQQAIKQIPDNAAIGFVQGVIREGRYVSQDDVADYLGNKSRASQVYTAVRGTDQPVLDTRILPSTLQPYWQTPLAQGGEGEEGTVGGAGGMELPPGLLNAIPESDRAYVQSLMAKDAAGTITQAESDILGAYLSKAFKSAGGGADNALGYAQLAESQRQFDIQQAFARERERNALEDALSKLRMRGAETQQSNLGNMMQFQQSLAPFALPPGTQYIPGNEPGGLAERLGGPRISPVSYDLSPYLQQVQQGTQGAINPLLQYIRSQQGGQ